MNRVALIFTGGTIGMTVTSSSEGAVPSLSADDLVSTLKKATGLENLESHEFSRLPSPHITPGHMSSLKEKIDTFLKDDEYSGVVVVHGTDTLEETAFYLDAVNDSEKPIVVTGSMKNASELGYDGLTNLASSIKVASDPESRKRGVLVVMHYEIHAACEVAKTHTLSLDTFKSIDFGPLGIIDEDEVLYYRSMAVRAGYNLANTFSEDVALIRAYSGIKRDIIDFYINAGYKGLVLEALGRGNLPPSFAEGIKKARETGLEVVITSRAPSGRVLDSYGYEGGGKDLVRHGCILGGRLSGPKARLLLMLGLGNGLAHAGIKRLFHTSPS